MKNLKIICLFILLFSSSFNMLFAQNTQPTPYQKKQLELTKKWFQILAGNRMSMTDGVFFEQLMAGKEANDFVLGLVILNYAMTHSKPQCETVFKQMNNEFKQSDKLKNATDFRIEKEAKLRKDQAEKEKNLLAEQQIFERTDVGSIQKNIKSNFEKWNQKGEFEKEADYTERLQNQSQNAFAQTCIEQIKSKIADYKDLNMELQPYNADYEFFTVKFRINNIERQGKINIPISVAENFKINWSHLKNEINDYDWCFIENGLCPTLIMLSDRTSKFQCTLPLQNQSEITYSFDDLGIDNPYLKGFLFKYSEAKAMDLQIEREKAIKDSLETVSFNNKLETTFRNYNSQLLANPYNIDKTLIADYQKISLGGNKEFYYNNSLNSLNHNNERIKKELERTFNQAYSNVSQFFSTEEEFKQFYKQGKEALQAEIAKRKEKEEERKILNYLNVNSKFTESMDFQQEKKESVGSALGRDLLGAATGNNVSARDYTNENESRKNILSAINSSRNKSYYSKIIDFVIETNKDLNKEWTKNGHYFNSKVELYDAYITDNYKQLLKEKKK